jgi:hypothetical protein
VAGDDFILSGWLNSNVLPKGTYQVKATFKNAGLVKATKVITFAAGSYSWSQKALAFTATTAYDQIIVQVVFKASKGSTRIDSVSLKYAP